METTWKQKMCCAVVMLFFVGCASPAKHTQIVDVYEATSHAQGDQVSILEQRGSPDVAWHRSGGTSLWVYCQDRSYPLGILFDENGVLLKEIGHVDAQWCEPVMQRDERVQ